MSANRVRRWVDRASDQRKREREREEEIGYKTEMEKGKEREEKIGASTRAEEQTASAIASFPTSFPRVTLGNEKEVRRRKAEC